MPAETRWTQAARKLAIATTLGEDKLILQSFRLTEELGRPFVCEVKLFSEDTEIVYDDIVGQNVTIRLSLDDEGGERYINGYVSRFVQGGSDESDSAHTYWATIVPWLWFLTRASDCRIYQNKKIPDIIKEVFSDFNAGEMVEDTLTSEYKELEYVVQYRETAFNFVSRLMEHEGIYYFFKHENGKHKLVLADAPSAHVEIENYEVIPCHDAGETDSQGISEWGLETRLLPGRHTLRDFDFKVPPKDMDSEKEQMGDHTNAGFEIFDYPGDYLDKSAGDTRAAMRIEELAMHRVVGKAKSDARGLTVGAKFKLSGADRSEQDVEYVITAMTCDANEEAFGAGAEGAERLFKSTFTAVPADVQLRPRRITPKPLITGPQTAIVTTSDGEEILTDEFGRVKVHFHWDRLGKFNETSSCFIRVAQIWAGKKWGAMFIPRKNQEVVVEFLEGDPDRPLITGRVYNGDNMPPYALPGSKNMSGIKSDSTKGGGGSNEWHFDDTKGSEKVTVHAQKDMSTTVEHDMSDTVKNNRTITVHGTHTETITKDTKITVSEGKLEHFVNTGTAAYYVKAAVTETFDDTQTSIAKKKMHHQSTEANIQVSGKTQVILHTGETTQVNMTEDGKVGISGTEMVSISCGDCLVQMKKDGSIKISGKKIEITGTEEVKIGVGAQNTTYSAQKIAHTGAAINSTAVGMHELAGAVIKIN